MINIPEHIKNLKSYKAGKPIEELSKEKGIKKIVKLASNENPLGPSPKALEAIKTHLNEVHRYTNPSAYRLVKAISDKYNITESKIITGNGSDSILQNIIAAFSYENDEIITSAGTFIGWYVNSDKFNRKSVLVPLKDYHYDLEAIAGQVSFKTRIIYLANPNNPTGTMFKREEFEQFMQKIPGNVLVILDEAYTAYADYLEDYPNGLSYDYDNLIVVRTLSKAYGLAGLRIGFAVGPAYLIKELYKVKLPFDPNSLAQEAAIAALNDDEFLLKTKRLNNESLELMKTKFNELDISFIDSAANFLLLLLPTEEFASQFNEDCLNEGLILRHVKSFGIPNGIRINSGTIDETNFAMAVIKKVYNQLVTKNHLETT